MYHKTWPLVNSAFISGVELRRKRPLRHSIGDIRHRKSGWSYQKVNGDNNDGLSTGYVKIRNPEGEVVDRALTIKAALARIQAHESKMPRPEREGKKTMRKEDYAYRDLFS